MVIRRASELEAPVNLPAQASGPPEEAMRLLHVLDPCGKFTFQTFDDRRDKRPEMVRVYHGTLEQHHAKLKRLNDDGAGIFFCVNQTDLQGREASNVIRVRALFVDLDGAPLEPVVAWRKPHITVESSPGKWHVYWLVRDFSLDDFKRAQQWLIAKFNSDNQVCDLPRVMRVPGYFHKKEQ